MDASCEDLVANTVYGVWRGVNMSSGAISSLASVLQVGEECHSGTLSDVLSKCCEGLPLFAAS